MKTESLRFDLPNVTILCPPLQNHHSSAPVRCLLGVESNTGSGPAKHVGQSVQSHPCDIAIMIVLVVVTALVAVANYRSTLVLAFMAALGLPLSLLCAFRLLDLPGLPANFLSMAAIVAALAVPLALFGALMHLDVRLHTSTAANDVEADPVAGLIDE